MQIVSIEPDRAAQRPQGSPIHVFTTLLQGALHIAQRYPTKPKPRKGALGDAMPK